MIAIVAALVTAPAPTAWFGPEHVEMSVPYAGNPYDPAENTVTVELTGANGHTFYRPAYYAGAGKFAANVVVPERGVFNVRFIKNGVVAAALATPVAVSTPMPHGYIGVKGNRFAWTDGTPYFPIGYDYGWNTPSLHQTVAEGVTEMGQNGSNWSRIWACHWDGKNPFFPSNKEIKLAGRELQQQPLQLWDGIVTAAQKADVHFQFVLFHYSSTTDSNWREIPWNAANGGFLKTPAEFFTSDEARRRTRIWLYNAVARYSYSPGVLAWELFNEVEWVDAMKTNIPSVVAWHKEMADYIRSIDPYHHPITSSSTMDHRELYATLDYLQPHTYPANVISAISAFKPDSRPAFFGEFGPPSSAKNIRQAVRDGIYAGILSGHAGAGMYWYWDNVRNAGLLPDYKMARQIIAGSGLLKHSDAKPIALSISTPTRGPLAVNGGMGWGKSTQFVFNLPLTDPGALGRLSPYFQSMNGAHKDWAAPLEFNFETTQSGFLDIAVGQVSSGGGDLTVFVNNAEVKKATWEAGSKNASTVFVPIPVGKVNVRIENHGADWVHIDRILIPGIAATADGHALGGQNWALVRIFGSDTSQVRVSGLTLKDGKYHATVYDLDKGGTSQISLDVAGGAFSTTNLPTDSVLAINGPYQN